MNVTDLYQIIFNTRIISDYIYVLSILSFSKNSDDAEQLKYKIIYKSYWCRSLIIRSTSDVFGIVLMGYVVNNYYIFQSHGDYCKYIKLDESSNPTSQTLELSISRINYRDIAIEYTGALTDINLIAFSNKAMQIELNDE